MIKFKHFVISCLMTFLLSACGFHLRGIDGHLNLKYPVWSISNGGPITQPLTKELLRRSGVKVEDSKKAAVIQFHEIDFNRQTQSINRYGRVDDFLYTLHVVVQIYFQGEPWGEPIQFNVKRYMTYRTDSLVVQEEEQHLRDEMYASVADMIVNRLYFLPDLPEKLE